MRLMKLSSKGDTIVEVLIAIAVLSSVLGTAYAITNRNISNLRNNQERTEATKIAQGQIEALVYKWSTTPSEIKSQNSSGFCIVSGSVENVGGSMPTLQPNITQITGPNYADCTFNTLYRVGIKRLNAADNSYRVYVHWDRLGEGQAINEVVYVHSLGESND